MSDHKCNWNNQGNFECFEKAQKRRLCFPHQGFGSNWETVAETEDEAQNI